MYREEPWTLSGKKKIKKKGEKDKSLYRETIKTSENTLAAILSFLKHNKDRGYTSEEISKGINRKLPAISIALNSLYQMEQIKIVGFETTPTNTLIPLYQASGVGKKGVEIVDLRSESGKKTGLITLPKFISEYSVVGALQFRYYVEGLNLEKHLVKNHSSYCYGYKIDQLKKAYKEYRNLEKVEINKSRFTGRIEEDKPTTSSMNKILFNLKILNFQITVSI